MNGEHDEPPDTDSEEGSHCGPDYPSLEDETKGEMPNPDEEEIRECSQILSQNHVHMPCANVHFKGIKTLLHCFNLMSSLCHQPHGSLTDDDMAVAKKVVALFNKMWRLMFKMVPPKTHMWEHLLENLERTRGMKFHNENPGEQEHQIAVALEKQFGNRNTEKKINSQLQARANKLNPKVQARQREVAAGSKRKLKTTRPQAPKRARISIDDLEKEAEGFEHQSTVEAMRRMNAKLRYLAPWRWSESTR